MSQPEPSLLTRAINAVLIFIAALATLALVLEAGTRMMTMRSTIISVMGVLLVFCGVPMVALGIILGVHKFVHPLTGVRK